MTHEAGAALRLKCPVCGESLRQAKSGNGGQLYVAEELETCTECYDEIDMNECCNNHVVYISKGVRI